MNDPSPNSVAEALQVALIELESDTGADGRAEAIRWLRAGQALAERDSLRMPLEGLVEDYSQMLRSWADGRTPTEDEARQIQRAWNRAVKALSRLNESRAAIRASLLKALVDRAMKHLHEWSSGSALNPDEAAAVRPTLEAARKSLAEEVSETQGYVPGEAAGSGGGDEQRAFLAALRGFTELRIDGDQLDPLALAALATHLQSMQQAARAVLDRADALV